MLSSFDEDVLLPLSQAWVATDRADDGSDGGASGAGGNNGVIGDDKHLGFFVPSRGGSASPDRHTGMGLPQLLNPVRLLAETSDVRKDSASHHDGPAAVLRGFMRRSRDHYEPRREPESVCGPVPNGILSESEARDLFRLFMEHINPIATMLDPLIHTYDFVTHHGSLLTAVCLVAAWHRSGELACRLANRLQDHLLTRCRPIVIVDRYCSIEIVIAFALYVQFHPCTDDSANDYSWTMLGEAIKCATELDVHSAILSQNVAPLDELGHRNARIRERTWLNLWLIEQSLSHQTGRRSSLTVNGALADCSDWHLSPHKVSGDAIVVGQISLRRIVMELQDFLARFSQGWSTATQDSKVGVDIGAIQLCLKRIRWEVDVWTKTWSHAEPTSTRSKKVQLYERHAKIVLCSTLLQKCPRTLEALDMPFFFLYESVIGYLSCLLDPANVQIIRYGQRGLFMTASYICCIAFKLIRIAHHAPWLSVETLRDLVQRVVTAFNETAAQDNAAYNTPRSHARFLSALLSSFEDGGSASAHTLAHGHVQPAVVPPSEVPCTFAMHMASVASGQGKQSHEENSDPSLLKPPALSQQQQAPLAGSERGHAGGETLAIPALDDASVQVGRDFVTWFDDFLFDSHLPAAT